MDEGADEELLKQVGNVMHTVLVEFQGCAGRSIFLWGGAGRGKGKNPRGGAKKRVKPLIHTFVKSALWCLFKGNYFILYL